METGDVGNVMDFSTNVQYMGTQLLRTIIAKLNKYGILLKNLVLCVILGGR